MKKLDKSKKSNIKCEHCGGYDKDNPGRGSCSGWCAIHQVPKNYWNRCKSFFWDIRYN